MDLQHIPLNCLKVSTLNMRHGRKAPDISDILPSIRARGVQQALLVRPNGEGYEIVAGRRRFFALKALAKEGCEIGDIPCAIMAEHDDAAALEASLIENFARLDPDEVTRWETFTRLVKQGRSVSEIATTFGVTEIRVRRALALGTLLPDIRSAYRNDEINADTIRQLTMASAAQQQEWLALFKDTEQHAPRGWQLKQWLWGAEISTNAALFPLANYVGGIVSDLFSEARYFDDPEQFWASQNAAISQRRDVLLEAGWCEVILLDIGQRFLAWEHVKTSMEDGGRVYIEICENGEVAVHEGFITQKEHSRRLRHTSGDDNEAPVSALRPELTQAAENYLALHRHAAVRQTLLDQPYVALRLLIAHAVCGSGLWRVMPEPQQADKESTAKSLEASKAEKRFKEERQAILALLGLPTDQQSLVRPNGDDYRVVELFNILLNLSDAEALRILAFVLAETLEAGSAVVEALGTYFSLDMRDY